MANDTLESVLADLAGYCQDHPVVFADEVIIKKLLLEKLERFPKACAIMIKALNCGAADNMLAIKNSRMAADDAEAYLSGADLAYFELFISLQGLSAEDALKASVYWAGVLGFKAYNCGVKRLDEAARRINLFFAARFEDKSDEIVEIGDGHLYGIDYPYDVEKSLKYYEKAARLGNVRAMRMTAALKAEGRGSIFDLCGAYRWFSEAYDRGDPASAGGLANLLDNPLFILHDRHRAFELYLYAAKHGINFAQFELSGMCASGAETRKNFILARKLLLAAAEDLPQAQTVAGFMYYFGTGLFFRNKSKAFKYLKLAAESDPNAQYLLGRMYFDRGQSAENLRIALKLWIKSAQQGNLDALFCIAQILLLHKGEEHSENFIIGIKCLHFAASRGHKPSREMLNKIFGL
ncbi:MAG: sel1 repeat family protein [bacterium]|nr:sel1 repeat family protein [bacterium]